MGCGSSKDSQTVAVAASPKSRKETVVDDHIKISAADFVGTRKGKISDVYKMDQTLGGGAFGEVKKGKHKKSGITRAIKLIRKAEMTDEELKNLTNEVEILKNLDHVNIMKVVETFEDKKNYYVVTELFQGGELFDRISENTNFNEKEAARIMQQVLQAVNYCHKNNIIHRDLKPENIMFDTKQSDALVKIIDFGTSAVYNRKNKLKQRFGTPYYIAPEVLNYSYDEKCDIWSCGVIMYILLCGFPPFNGDSDNEILDAVQTGKFSFNFKEFSQVSEEAKNLIKRMLEYNPKKRVSAEVALQDGWFKQCKTGTVDKPLAQNVLKNLKNFRVREKELLFHIMADQKLQEATWVFLVTYLASQEEKSELLKMFQTLDKNGDGKLTRDEIIEGYRTLLGSDDPERDADLILQSIDNNNSGAIDYNEFVVATMDKQKLLSKERLETAFKIFDADGSGYITADELREIFNPGNVKNIDEEVFKQWILDVDQNSDGKISMAEFKGMMLKMLK